MSLLREIQIAVLNERSELAPILLKLRLLAGRLESQPLADWVRHESEGYPADVALPSYRQIPVTYTASFAGSFGSAINNAPIPPYLIEEFAGAHWNNYEMRQSIAAIDDLMAAVVCGSSMSAAPRSKATPTTGRPAASMPRDCSMAIPPSGRTDWYRPTCIARQRPLRPRKAPSTPKRSSPRTVASGPLQRRSDLTFVRAGARMGAGATSSCHCNSGSPWTRRKGMKQGSDQN